MSCSHGSKSFMLTSAYVFSAPSEIYCDMMNEYIGTGEALLLFFAEQSFGENPW